MRRFLLAAVMASTAASAQAADMPDFLRGTLPAGPAPVTNWQGVYIGGQASAGQAVSNVAPGINSDIESTFIPPTGTSYPWQSLNAARSIAVGYGGFAGYNWQFDDVVVGVEGNYIHSGFHSVTTATGMILDPVTLNAASTTINTAAVNLTDFGSLRARAGYAFGCFLPYVFGGAAFGSQTVDRYAAVSPQPIVPALTSNSRTDFVYGFSVGGGMDMMLVGGLFLRAEYEYTSLRARGSFESDVNSGRLGVGYKF
jgi:outer membrane immunogenic protein